MIRLITLLLFLFLSASFVYAAGPVKRTLGEPRGPSPKKAASQTQGLSENFRLSYASAVNKYVERSLDGKDKLFHFWDQELEEEWTLSLVKVNHDKLVTVGHDRYFAPVDFIQKDQTGEGEDTPFVLDVYALKIPEGWEVEEIYIQSINDRVRYKYDKEFNRIPLNGNTPN